MYGSQRNRSRNAEDPFEDSNERANACSGLTSDPYSESRENSGGGGFVREGGFSGGEGGFVREDSGRGGGGFQRQTGCSLCSNLTVDPEFLETYKVRVCRQCKRSKEMDLIPKSKAKMIYLLADKDIAELGFLTRANPQQKTWSQMHLYLKAQVEALSYEKYGGAEGLEEEKKDKFEERMVKASDKKRKHAVTSPAVLASRQTILRNRIDATQAPHEHVFGDPICVDADEGTMSKTCKLCSVVVTFEEM